MRTWLAAMVHPDGGIAFFNEGALGWQRRLHRLSITRTGC